MAVGAASPCRNEQKGISAWIKDELEASFAELQSQGLKIQSMVFPYNAFTRELSTEAMKRFKSFRRDEVDPVSDRIGEDGSIPGTEIDTAFYVPVAQMFKWIDFARQQNRLLFIYGHKVLPDEDFFTGTVSSVSTLTLVSKERVKTFAEKDLCLVPDTRRRLYRPIKVEAVSGDTITTFQGDLFLISATGAAFIVGPCYGMPLSYFREVIKYGAERLPFYTVDQAVSILRQAPKKQ